MSSAIQTFYAPMVWVGCDENKGGVAIMSHEAWCGPGKETQASQSSAISFWNEFLRECLPLGTGDATSGRQCPSSKWKPDDFKSVGDAVRVIAPDMAGVVIGFSELIVFMAMLELLGYTLGSKCQAVTVIILGVINTVMGLLGGLVVWDSGVLDDDFAKMMCEVCAIDHSDPEGSTPMGGSNGLFWSGILSIAIIIFGAVMLCKSNKEIAYVNVAPDRNPDGGKKTESVPASQI